MRQCEEGRMFGPCAGILPDSKAWALSGVLLPRAWGGMSTSVFCCVHSLTAAAAIEGPVAIPESLYNQLHVPTLCEWLFAVWFGGMHM